MEIGKPINYVPWSMDLRKPCEYVDAWQLFDLCSVPGCPLFTISPSRGNPGFRQYLQRLMKPDKRSNEVLFIMWTSTPRYEGWTLGPNVLVPYMMQCEPVPQTIDQASGKARPPLVQSCWIQLITFQMHVKVTIVCQMLSWRTKEWPHFINIWDTVTNVVPLHSVHQAPSYEHILTLLAWFLLDLAFLSMLFIREVLCTAWRTNSVQD